MLKEEKDKDATCHHGMQVHYKIPYSMSICFDCTNYDRYLSREQWKIDVGITKAGSNEK